MNVTEEQFVLRCARVRPSPEDYQWLESAAVSGQLDWQRIASLASSNRISGLVLRSLTAAGAEIHFPADSLNVIREQASRMADGTQRNSRALAPVLRACHEAGIPVMVHKGLALGERIYQDVRLRGDGDIDILVRKSDLPRAKKVLGSLGYRRSRESLDDGYYERHHLHIQRCSADRTVWYEIHWALDHPYTTFAIDYERLFQDAERGTLLGEPAYLFAPDDLLLVLSVHLAKEIVELASLVARPDFAQIIGARGSFYLFCDVAETVRVLGSRLPWDRFLLKINEWNLREVVGPALAGAVRLLDAPVPEEVLGRLRPLGRASRPSQILTGLIYNNGGDGGRGARHLLRRALMDQHGVLILRPVRVFDVARYLLPPNGYLRARYHVSGRSRLSLYRGLHFVRGMAALATNLGDWGYFTVKKRFTQAGDSHL